MANRLRKHSIVSTTEAGSGHPSTCLSCAELISALFFYALRFDVQNPKDVRNDCTDFEPRVTVERQTRSEVTGPRSTKQAFDDLFK